MVKSTRQINNTGYEKKAAPIFKSGSESDMADICTIYCSQNI